jgi:hypothetical protein
MLNLVFAVSVEPEEPYEIPRMWDMLTASRMTGIELEVDVESIQ